MNEHVGFVVCPQCQSPWGDGQWACPYCHNTEPPAAVKAPGPAWMWWLISGVVLLAAGIDLSLGGHGWRFVTHWLNSLS